MPLFGPGLRVAPGPTRPTACSTSSTLEGGRRPLLLPWRAHLRRGTHLGRDERPHCRAARDQIATGGRSPVIADTTDMGSDTVELTVEPHALEIVGSGRMTTLAWISARQRAACSCRSWSLSPPPRSPQGSAAR